MTETPSGDNTYVLDSESPTEMVRLINQDLLVTRAMGGPLAEQSPETIREMRYILDLGCGPGSWVLDTAFAYPEIEVAGVDISNSMISYACARALSQGLTNASFEKMDITKPLQFADASFDMVNARFLVAVLHRDVWPSFLAECTRILRPGGILRLTEPVDFGTTTSIAFERLHSLGALLFQRTNHGFSPDGRGPGIVPVLPRLLRQTGYREIRHAAHALEFSAGTPAWADFYHNTDAGSQMGQPILVKMGLITREEVERLHSQMLIEMNEPDFCGILHFTTFWSTKPANPLEQ